MKKVYVKITRVGIHEQELLFKDDTTEEEILNELNELAFEIEDDIEMDNEIEYSIKEAQRMT